MNQIAGKSSLHEGLEKLYGFKIESVLPEHMGYRNRSYPFTTEAGEHLNFIVYKDEPDILNRVRNANKVSGLLSAGLPARTPYDGRLIEVAACGRRLVGCLYLYLPGEVIPWEAYTAKHLKLLGQAMAKVHNALSETDGAFLPDVEDEYLAITGRMRTYFSQPGVKQAMKEKLGLNIRHEVFDYCASVINLCRRLPDRQALHMDLVRGNILFDEGSGGLFISGILDFEKASYGFRYFDLGRTLAFLLTDSFYKSDQEVFKNFLLRGYVRAGGGEYKSIKVGKTDLLAAIIDLFCVYDFYKFLKHAPYESLPDNHHFVRTRERLLKRGLVTPG
ncbi:MAG TPA: phosphotransferase [Candidatus Saccharimonadales bacterium]|nr:phosphotransferase [Candidatus Saccharimonadales bacterium]